ncbi:MAG: hypothetical protein CMJ87_02460 [Planctomycetes bacterium]|jgi:hypothetical protein|nr:hypothetical protein [Planctomycetota bacterium]MDP6519919.1 PEGA domain-containing protein [Planctomycetota bacterium]
MNRFVAATCLALAPLVSCAGVKRVLTIESTPPGATVRLDERIIGETPLEHAFDHYGTVRLTMYLESHRTKSVRVELKPPWYCRFPLDLVSDFLWPIGWTDRHRVAIALRAKPVGADATDIAPVLERARLAREQYLFPQTAPAADPATPNQEEGEPQAPNGKGPVHGRTEDLPRGPGSHPSPE